MSFHVVFIEIRSVTTTTVTTILNIVIGIVHQGTVSEVIHVVVVVGS